MKCWKRVICTKEEEMKVLYNSYSTTNGYHEKKSSQDHQHHHHQNHPKHRRQQHPYTWDHPCPLPLVGRSYMSGELNFMSMDLVHYIMG
jgi:hypothetical protein